jgi:hypothetical protein
MRGRRIVVARTERRLRVHRLGVGASWAVHDQMPTLGRLALFVRTASPETPAQNHPDPDGDEDHGGGAGDPADHDGPPVWANVCAPSFATES